MGITSSWRRSGRREKAGRRRERCPARRPGGLNAREPWDITGIRDWPGLESWLRLWLFALDDRCCPETSTCFPVTTSSWKGDPIFGCAAAPTSRCPGIYSGSRCRSSRAAACGDRSELAQANGNVRGFGAVPRELRFRGGGGAAGEGISWGIAVSRTAGRILAGRVARDAGLADGGLLRR